jgi:hypothetical protein
MGEGIVQKQGTNHLAEGLLIKCKKKGKKQKKKNKQTLMCRGISKPQ